MAAQPDRYPYQAVVRELEAVYRAAQATIAAQVQAAVRAGDLQAARGRELQLVSVQRVLGELADHDPLAAQAVARAFQQGSQRAGTQAGRLSFSSSLHPSFHGVSREAVEALQASLLERLDSARQTLGRRVQDIYAREQRRSALRAILGAAPSPSAASRDLQAQLMRDRHVARAVREAGTGFVDRAGRRWALDTYANMAVRTVTREAVVQGAVTRMVSHGIAIARVSTHRDACEICVPHQGELVSLTPGSGPAEWKGEPVSHDGELPPFHPNCRHSLMPVAGPIEELRERIAEGEAAGVG